MQQRVQDVALQVVTAVADTKGIDPVDVTPPLTTVIDADALNTVCEDLSSGKLTFLYSGCVVTVTATGDVSVQESDSASR